MQHLLEIPCHAPASEILIKDLRLSNLKKNYMKYEMFNWYPLSSVEPGESYHRKEDHGYKWRSMYSGAKQLGLP